MRKVETEILFRPHYLSELISKPIGKSNFEIYKDAKEKAEKLAEKLELENAKLKALNDDLTALEAVKHNDVPARKGSKSPKEKYFEQLQKIEKQDEKVKELIAKQIEAEAEKEKAEKNKDKINLSKSAKKRLKTIAIEIKYKRRKRLINKYVRKGLLKEDEGAELYSEFLGEALTVEKERKKSDYFTGETDLRKYNKDGEVIEITDIKNRYDLDTLEDRRGEEMDAENAAQLLGYLDLYPTAKCLKIANVLCDNDFTLINDEIRAETFRTKAEELNATGSLNDSRIIEIAKENIYSKSRFIAFLSMHIDSDTIYQLVRGKCKDEEAQQAFDDFIELEIEERIIEQVQEVTDEHFTKLEEVKKILDECRNYLAETYNIHHTTKN